jgi:hypothetical protein
LEKLHKQRLRVDFDDDDVNAEQQIEILTADITKVRSIRNKYIAIVEIRILFRFSSFVRRKALRCV